MEESNGDDYYFSVDLVIIDDVADDLKSISSKLSKEDRQLLEEHMSLVRKVEKDLKVAEK